MANSTGRDLFEKAKAKKNHVAKPDGAKVTGVTALTYSTLAKAYIDGHNSQVFVIVARTTSHRGERLSATVDEWGAWIAYFFLKGIKIKWAEAHGYYTVPAQWPHDFDESAPPEADYEAAKHYRDSLRKRIAQESEGREAPADLGRKVRTFWGDVKRGMPIWEDKKPEPKPRVYTPEELAESLKRCQEFSRRTTDA